MGLEDMTLLMRVYDGLKTIEEAVDQIMGGKYREGAVAEALWLENYLMKYSIFDIEKEDDIVAFLNVANDRKFSQEQRAKMLLGIK